MDNFLTLLKSYLIIFLNKKLYIKIYKTYKINKHILWNVSRWLYLYSSCLYI